MPTTTPGRDRLLAFIWAECLERDGLSDLPIIVLIDPHGDRKTAVLKQLAEKCKEQEAQPYVNAIDLETKIVGSHPWQLLDRLAIALSDKSWPKSARLRFPRFTLGRLVVEEQISTDSLTQALGDINKKLSPSNPDFLKDLNGFGVPRWLTLPALALIGIGWLARRLLARRRFKVGKKFYANALPATNELLALRDLNALWANGGAESRAEVDRVLAEAFLEDLAKSYSRGFRPRNCLVVLNNADSALGKSVIDALSAGKTKEGGPDPLVVVATAKGNMAQGQSRPESKVSLADWRNTQKEAPKVPESWLYQIHFQDLYVPAGTDEDGGHGPAATPVYRTPHVDRHYPWRKLLWDGYRKLTVSTTVVLVAALAIVIYLLTRPTPPVYVTDGSHVFNSNLKAVEAKIKHENDWVTASGQPYVSIAVLATMSPQPKVEPLDYNRTRHAIEGAYLAQYEANHPAGPAGRPGEPLIKLLLADEGSQEKTWSQAVAALKDRVSSSDHLVAVTGLGISVPNTTKVVKALNTAPHVIGMVGAVITGNELSGIPGMVRIAPTNTDEATAAASFLDSEPDPHNPLSQRPRVCRVQDQNAADSYAHTLGHAFPKALRAWPSKRHYMFVPNCPVYNSALPNSRTVLGGMGDSVCHARANVVYFAGRGVDLQDFLIGLAHRYCATTRPLTVLTGSDATQLVNHGGLWPTGANMTVYFTALAHPQVWKHQPPVADQATVAWFGMPRYGFRAVFPGETLNDGWGIMFHDAVLTAVTAIQKLYTQRGAIPPGGAVAQELNQVTVHGASGYICFNTKHDPINKAIPVVELGQDGRLSYVTLSSASGKAPVGNNCE
jgi:hypothetical protein